MTPVKGQCFFCEPPPCSTPVGGIKKSLKPELETLFYAADGGRTRTLSPERDFKSLVSANFTTAAR